MGKKKGSGGYEVGYGKPPKATQFQKGASGNPNGRRKKAEDFYTELISESRASITINDNGKPARISKLRGIAKQLTNKALTGDIRAMRILLSLYPEAHERAALSAALQSRDLRREDPKNLSDEELERFIVASLEEKKRKVESDTYRARNDISALVFYGS